MTTSIVIPSFNGRAFLAANLPAVLALLATEVIVVDDASTDGSADFIAGHFPHIKLIRHPQNVGFPQTVNDGFTATSGDIVFLLNQDIVPAPDLITKTLPHFTDPAIIAVTFNENNRSWASAQLIQGFLAYTNGPLDNALHQSFWASGGGSAFRRSAWTTLGGFDTVFSPGYFEDLDLGWRAHRAGFKIVWAPQAIVSHAQPESTFKQAFTPGRLQRLKDRNYLLMHWKNLDTTELPAHLLSIFRRLVAHPGFILPILMALPHLPGILFSRHPSRLSNAAVFAKLS